MTGISGVSPARPRTRPRGRTQFVVAAARVAGLGVVPHVTFAQRGSAPFIDQGTVRLPEHEGPRWFELKPQDAFYIPEAIPHQYYNMADGPVAFLFRVAHQYRPGSG